MRLYPAFRFSMGGYPFFVTKMNASEIAETVKFASDVFQGKTLSDAIQRSLNEHRASKDIAKYWKENEARFFNAIVVAAWGGEPNFAEVDQISSGEGLLDSLIAKNERMRNSFGILVFDGSEVYFALDGQHRVKAIGLMYDNPEEYPRPEGFLEDDFTVIIVPTRHDENEADFKMRYRRMFSALNRYARPTDNATNIIMDEDDVFAIVTRYLIADHPFFAWGESDWENPRVKTGRGKNMRATDSYFTQIEVLYNINRKLLTSAEREDNELAKGNIKEFIQVRPDEDYISIMYKELETIWNGLLEVLPALRKDPTTMRVHNPEPEDDQMDHVLFWPIGQEMVAGSVRMLLDRARLSSPPSKQGVVDALRGLSKVEWSLHSWPWRHLLLVQEEPGARNWRMRSEGRADAIKIGKKLLNWILGGADYDQDGVERLRMQWQMALYQAGDEDLDAAWEHITAMKMEATGGRL